MLRVTYELDPPETAETSDRVAANVFVDMANDELAWIAGKFIDMAQADGGTTIAVCGNGDTVVTGAENGELLLQSISFHTNASIYVPTG